MTDVKLWLLYSKTCNHLTVHKKELRLNEKCYVKNVYRSYIHNIYV